MKPFLTLALAIAMTPCFSQTASLVPFQDTVNHFSIGIPDGWRHGVNKNFPSIKLIAFRSPADTSDHPRENFNLNVIEKRINSSLEKEFHKLLAAEQSTGDFTLLENDSVSIHGQPFKWFVETHNNPDASLSMSHYVFVTYKDERTYILTFVTVTEAFKKYRPLFTRIAETLVL
jgi:hypothetical protein